LNQARVVTLESPRSLGEIGEGGDPVERDEMELPCGASGQPAQRVTEDVFSLKVRDGPLPFAPVTDLALVKLFAAGTSKDQLATFGFARVRFPLEGKGSALDNLESTPRHP